MVALRHYDVIVAPVITEKTPIASAQNQVVFNVKVIGVNTLIRKGKVKRFRGTIGRLSNVKKAVVTLADGNSIDVSTGL